MALAARPGVPHSFGQHAPFGHRRTDGIGGGGEDQQSEEGTEDGTEEATPGGSPDREAREVDHHVSTTATMSSVPTNRQTDTTRRLRPSSGHSTMSPGRGAI